MSQADFMFLLGTLAYASLAVAVVAVFLGLRRKGASRRRWLLVAAACGCHVVACIAGLILGEFEEDWPFVLGALIATLVGLGLLIWALFSDRSCGRRRCPRCWYDMSNAPAEASLRCPECGREAKCERQLFKTRRRWRWVAASLLIFLIAAFLAVQPKVRQEGWAVITPTTILILALRFENNEWAFEALDDRARVNYDYPAAGEMFIPSGSTLFKWQWKLLGNTCLAMLAEKPPAMKRAFLAGWLDRTCDGLPKDSAERFHQAILLLLKDDDAEIRRYAALFCADSRWPELCVDSLRGLAGDPQPRVRVAAITGLRLLSHESPAALAPLIEALEHEDADVRMAAASAIGSMGDRDLAPENAYQRLVETYYGDPDARVRAAALGSLNRFKSYRDDQLLQAALKSPLPEVRAEALEVLASLPWVAEHQEFVVNATFEGLRDDSYIVRTSALWLLEYRLPHEPLIARREDLESLLAHEDVRVRDAAEDRLNSLSVASDD